MKIDSKPVWENVARNLKRYKNGTYYANIRAGGKLTVKSLETNIRSVANLRLADLEKSLRTMVEKQNGLTNGRMTFGDALNIFTQRTEANPKHSLNTKLYYSNRVKGLKASWPELEARDVRRVSEDDCIQWAGKFAKDNSESSYNATIGILKKCFDIAIKKGGRLDNPAESLKRIAQQPKQLRLPSSEQWTKFVEAVGSGGGNRNRYSQPCAFFVQFCAFGGFRKSEAANVLWQDCDFNKGTIFIVEYDDKDGDTAKDRNFRIKNGQWRVIPMIDDMRALLENIKAFNVKCGRAIKNTDRVMQVSECERSMTRACAEVGMTRITHHDLRHLFATRCIESGVDIPTVSRWLGHKDGGALAMKVYGHLRQDHSLMMAKKVSFAAPKNLVRLEKAEAAA